MGNNPRPMSQKEVVFVIFVVKHPHQWNDIEIVDFDDNLEDFSPFQLLNLMLAVLYKAVAFRVIP